MQYYHNPRCTKSRQALALLNEKGIEPEVILYLETPPSKEALKGILKKLGIAPRDLMRKKEAEYKESGANDNTLSDDALIDCMVKFPKLIERPIFINGEKATIGRPPENVLEIL